MQGSPYGPVSVHTVGNAHARVRLLCPKRAQDFTGGIGQGQLRRGQLPYAHGCCPAVAEAETRGELRLLEAVGPTSPAQNHLGTSGGICAGKCGCQQSRVQHGEANVPLRMRHSSTGKGRHAGMGRHTHLGPGRCGQDQQPPQEQVFPDATPKQMGVFHALKVRFTPRSAPSEPSLFPRAPQSPTPQPWYAHNALPCPSSMPPGCH